MDPALDGWYVLRQQSATVAMVVGLMLWGVAVTIGFLGGRGMHQLGADEFIRPCPIP